MITSVSISFICYVASTLCAFILIIFGYTEAQLLSISEEICALSEYEPTLDDDNRSNTNSEVRKKLVQIMETHFRIIDLLKNANEFFDVPNVVAFGCLGIALIAELLGGLENTYLQIQYTFLYVAMYCFIGQKITDASMTIERSVYACKWENFDKDNMKIVLIMLQNSQQTLKMSAGSMFVMNYSCLMTIIKMVYSTYTTLRSTIKS